MHPSKILKLQYQLYLLLASISLFGVIAGLYLEEYLLLLTPLALIGIYIGVTDFKKLFYLLLFLLPISIEFDLPNGFATDLPTEPLMVGLMIIFLLYVAARPQAIDLKFLKHPIILLVMLHYFWIGITMLNSEDLFVSFKYFLAKTWYLVVFLFMAGNILNKESEIKKFFWLIFIPLSLVALQTLIRHYQVQFAFEDINDHSVPFFRNHVNYAAMLSMFYPFLFLAGTWYNKGTFKKRLINFSKIFFLVAIYFSYTRACYLAIIIAAFSYLVINWGLLKWAVKVSVIVAALFVSYLITQNNYMRFAPEYEKTLQHSHFDDHITATYKLQDVSSMERVYRWVASFYMFADNPYMGYGPGNFHPYYKKYTVSEFVTYVSDNEERSSVHNYFLLMLVEQGMIGLLIFLTLTIATLVYGQKAYSRSTDPAGRRLIMTQLLVLIILYANLMLSDLIEVDKTGSLFFMSIAIMVSQINKEETLKEAAT